MTDTRWVIATDGTLVDRGSIDMSDGPRKCVVCGTMSAYYLWALDVTREGKVMSYFCEACGSTMRREE